MLNKETLRQFLSGYERLREREKAMISLGYNDKHFTKGRLYARLLKTFAKRAEATEELGRRPSLIGRGDDAGPPVLMKADAETQTDEPDMGTSVECQTDAPEPTIVIECGAQTLNLGRDQISQTRGSN